MAFSLLLTRVVILTLRKGLISSYFFVPRPLSQWLLILPDIFLREGIIEPALPGVFDCPSAWSCPPSVQFRFREEAMWRKVWQGVVFMHNFWNFKAIPDTEIIFTSIQSKLVLKKFKWFQWRGFQKWWKFFILLLVKIWSDIWFVKKGLNFNLRVIENQIGSKHLFYLHE